MILGQEIARGSEGVISRLVTTTNPANSAKKFVMTTEICARTGSIHTRWLTTADLSPLDLVVKHGPGVKDELNCLVTLMKKLAASHGKHLTPNAPRALLRIVDMYSPFQVLDDTSSILLGFDRSTIVMKRMDGTLREFYALPEFASSPGGVWYVLSAVVNVLLFLSLMHDHDTFHGDIKDDNILYRRTTSSQPGAGAAAAAAAAAVTFVLTDFGHMRTLRRRSMSDAKSGTPGSRSPFSYKRTDIAADENETLFHEDHIVPTAIADARHVWLDYAPIMKSTSKKRQLVKTDLYAVGVILARVVDADVAQLARACIFASQTHAAAVKPFWTAREALVAVKRVLDKKRNGVRTRLVLDTGMPGGPVVPKKKKKTQTKPSSDSSNSNSTM
jgi:serine/threonine protein kinase